MILRSTTWDGLPPAPGDVVQMAHDQVGIVQSVAQGPGAGQWRLDVEPTRLIVWVPGGG